MSLPAPIILIELLAMQLYVNDCAEQAIGARWNTMPEEDREDYRQRVRQADWPKDIYEP